MQTYKSEFLGLQMSIPDGWDVRMWPDDDVEELAEGLQSGSLPADANTIRPLMFAELKAPSIAGIDACIKLQACDEDFLKTGEPQPLTDWDVNGIPVQFFAKVRDGEPERMHYRFPHWQVKPGLWLYATVLASGKERFEYTLSIFRTLMPIGQSPASADTPLFECPPWTEAPSFYRLVTALDDDRPFYDLAIESDLAEEALTTNADVLSGTVTGDNWVPMDMRRKRRVLKSDCHVGPEGLYSVGLFSGRAVALLRSDLSAHFVELPCTVNEEPFFFLAPKDESNSYLDLDGSQIEYFEDGDIAEVQRYRFQRDLLPDSLIFSIPEERTAIFATASIPDKIKDAGLKGIVCHPVNGHGRDHTCPG